MFVFGICKKGNRPFPSFFNLGESVDGDILVTFHTALYELRDLFRREFHLNYRLLVFNCAKIEKFYQKR